MALASTLSAGASTLSSLTVSGASTLDSVDIGGGYASTGVSISNAGVVGVAGALTVDGASGLAAVNASGNLTVATTKFTVASASGDTAIAGNLAIATNKFTVAAASGDTAIAGVGSLSKSGSDFLVKAETGASLKFTALGDEAFNLALDGEQASFDALFTATSIIGAIMEAKNQAVSAGYSQKGTLTSANVAADVLTFSSIGTLSSAAQKYIDVFLNGVLLAPVIDVVSVTTTTATLNADIDLVADDVITVCLRSTTA